MMSSKGKQIVNKLREILRAYPPDDQMLRIGSTRIDEKLNDEDLLLVTERLVSGAFDATEIVGEYFPEVEAEDIKEALIYSFNRLSVHAVAMKSSIMAAVKEMSALPVPTDSADHDNCLVELKTFKNSSLLEVLRECQISMADAKPADDLAVLLEVQKRRVFDLLDEASKSPKGHLMLSKKINEAIRIYYDMLHKAAYLQMDMGIKQKSRRKEAVMVERAFNELLETSGDKANTMAQFAKAVAESVARSDVKKRIGKAVAKELNDDE